MSWARRTQSITHVASNELAYTTGDVFSNAPAQAEKNARTFRDGKVEAEEHEVVRHEQPLHNGSDLVHEQQR